MSGKLTIRPMRRSDMEQIKIFTDETIGQNYYSEQELLKIFDQSQIDSTVCSLVLVDIEGKIRGIRMTYPPGKWKKGKGEGLRSDMWQIPVESVAYFQSLFVDPNLTNQGWGKKLSMAAIEILKDIGAQGVVAHSWKESPGDSSGRYLRSLGFKKVATHPEYWKDVDYVCTRCGKPCLCTAEEMILYFNEVL